MNFDIVEPRGWSRRKLWGTIALVFALQLALILALGLRSAATPGPVPSTPRVRLNPEPSELLALLDPTLFALPHRQAFSGKTWTRIAPSEFHPADWSETPLWLGLPVPQLGAAFREFVQTSTPLPLQVMVPEPELSATAPARPISMRSTLRVEGGLSRRQLLSSFELSGWHNSNLLTNSVVEVVVDPRGYTMSPALLSGSGSVEADRRALELAKTARFAPAEAAGPGLMKSRHAELTLGTLVFEWQTLPPTNAPSP